MNLVDSSGWLEYFLDGPRASLFEKQIFDTQNLIVPTIVTYEVYRQLIKKIDPQEVVFVIAQMEKGVVVPLEQNLALSAAEMSLQYKLGTADAIVYATALLHKARLVTLDNDFRKLPHCEIF